MALITLLGIIITKNFVIIVFEICTVIFVFLRTADRRTLSKISVAILKSVCEWIAGKKVNWWKILEFSQNGGQKYVNRPILDVILCKWIPYAWVCVCILFTGEIWFVCWYGYLKLLYLNDQIHFFPCYSAYLFLIYWFSKVKIRRKFNRELMSAYISLIAFLD